MIGHIQDNSKGHYDFALSRYDNDGKPVGGEYKNKHRVKKKYL